MSTSSEYSEVSGNKPPAKSPEKTTFSQTCSLLSQYIKEKGCFKDLSLGITCNNNNTDPSGSSETSSQSATTMNLFPTMENNLTQKNLTTMNLLTPQAALNNSNANKGPKAAQLTMFYNGQVIVFDDFPADKAQELMAFANKGISQSQNNSVYTYTQSQPSFPPNLVRTSVNTTTPIVPTVNIIPSTATGTGSINEHLQVPSRPNLCDLPIMRKASLHRFLEKRKDRIAANAPYQINKPAESMSWLVGAKSTQI